MDVCRITGAKYTASPLGLMTVAALLPQHWEFKLVDENVEPLTDDHFKWADMVFTGGMLPQQSEILKIIDKAHQFERPVVVGGPDPTSQPEVYKSADYLVTGEGEITIPMFLEDLSNGSKGGRYSTEGNADMTRAVVPRFDLIDFNNYMQVGIQYTRGCPFLCEFCDIIELYGRVPRSKTNEQVILELQTLYDLGYRGYVDLVDDNFIGNKKNVKKLLPAIKQWLQEHGHPFYFATEASMNLASDDTLLQMMKDVDFRYVFIGIETPEEDILIHTLKKQNLNKPVADAVAKINSYGMVVPAGFIIGFDNESKNSASYMIQCIQDSNICMAMLGTLFALPNTQLTRRLAKEGRLYKEYSTQTNTNGQIDQMTGGLNFVTKRPKPEVLRDYVTVLESIYSPDNYFKRVINMSLQLRRSGKFKPSFREILRLARSFFRICGKLGFNRTTGLLYWKMLFIVLIRNPASFEQAISMAVMFLHLHKHSGYITQITQDKIDYIEGYGEENYNQIMVGMSTDSAPLPHFPVFGASLEA